MAGVTWTYTSPTGAGWSQITDATVPNGGAVFQAVAISHSQATTASITATIPPGGSNINFYYKVDSEANYDFLTFMIDGVAPANASWSGQVGWTVASFPVTAGIHTFSWTYSKDASFSVGADTAWLSQVSFSVAPIATTTPVIYGLSPIAGPAGSVVTISGANLNLFNPPLVSVNGASAVVATNSATAVTVTIPAGAAAGSNTLSLGSATLTPINAGVFNVTASVNGPGPMAGTWTYDLLWPQVVDNTVPNLGTVFKAATITHSQSTTASTTVTVPAGGGGVSFYYKVDSELGFDFLTFTIDGVAPAATSSWSGAVPWTLANFPISAGTHTLSWTYSKDASVSVGLDTAWLSQVAIGVAPTPTVTGFTPASGPAGALLTITGTNLDLFNSPAALVAVSGVAATVNTVTPTAVTATIPAGLVLGNNAVTLGSATLAPVAVGNFNVVAPPTITGLTPTAGAVGSTVTITGTNLDLYGAIPSVSFSDPVSFLPVAAAVVSATPTAITFTVPAITYPAGLAAVNNSITLNGVSMSAAVVGDFNVGTVLTTTGAGPMAGTWSYASYSGAIWAQVADPAVAGGIAFQASPPLAAGALTATFPDYAATTASITVTVPAGVATVSFDQKVDSELIFDFLTFAIDGIPQSGASWSGPNSSGALVPVAPVWTHVSFPITPGTHTLSWTYSKDSMWFGGQDTAWIANVTMP